ncbi:hypothetical protein MHM84_20565 [Halomonas sp. McH1-25]|uniref:hypothetical protein n=1 Tax=unclassified Halomonas TaxID=2609666 RepID=UPI001EF71587|nr:MULTISPECIES: hypothetical protein [unclassified Halomonas]MCG7602133.1 hypothetical protein [Halomonas sp. McH1-25]MCP1344410.1 hypothetical protein [Halomonas sp. FL8]MCP1362500.1 hypothetical protein [Halomonas sp. BBD45]
MARARKIQPAEVSLWLGILLDAAFDPTTRTLNLARSAELANKAAQAHGMTNALILSARDGRSQLLALASDFVNYPEEYSDRHRAELLLDWANRWIQPEDWLRLQTRLRKRREYAKRPGRTK